MKNGIGVKKNPDQETKNRDQKKNGIKKIGLDSNEKKERKEGKEGKTKGTNVARKDVKDNGKTYCQRISGRISDWFQKQRHNIG